MNCYYYSNVSPAERQISGKEEIYSKESQFQRQVNYNVMYSRKIYYSQGFLTRRTNIDSVVIRPDNFYLEKLKISDTMHSKGNQQFFSWVFVEYPHAFSSLEIGVVLG